MRYRVAIPADAEALAQFGGRLFVQSYEQWAELAELEAHVVANFTPALQAAEIASPNLTSFLALDEAGAIAGYAQLAVGNLPTCTVTASAPAELKRIYVDRNWHGQNIAPILLGLVEDAARQRGCDVLWLAVWEINERAMAFYHKHNFNVVGRQGFPVGSDDQSDYVMAKPLADELH